MYNTNNKTFHLKAPVAHKTGRTILPCGIIIAHKLHMQRLSDGLSEEIKAQIH